MGGCFSCGRYNRYILDTWINEIEEKDDTANIIDDTLKITSTKIIYKGIGNRPGEKEPRSLEKMVERGMIEIDTYLMFKNTDISEVGIVRSLQEGSVSIEFMGGFMSLTQFCKKAAAKHGKIWNGTPWNSVWTIDADDAPLTRIDKLWVPIELGCDEAIDEKKMQ